MIRPLSIALALSFFLAIGTARADRDGDFYYAIGGNEAVITNFANKNYAGHLTIPNTLGGKAVTAIGPNSFHDCYDMTGVTIPATVTNIGDEAFYDCKTLDNLALPNGLRSIGERAFSQCTTLSSVTLPGSLQSIGQQTFQLCTNLNTVEVSPGIQAISEQMFYECGALRSVSLPETLRTISDLAFASCSSLERLVIPTGVTNIGTAAFMMCSSLAALYLPPTLATLGDAVFLECVNLQRVYFAGNAPTLGSYEPSDSAERPTLYYLPGTTGWSNTLSGYETALWNPQVNLSTTAGATSTLTITGAPDLPVGVESRTNLLSGSWEVVVGFTNLTGGTWAFQSPATDGSRFFRVFGP